MKLNIIFKILRNVSVYSFEKREIVLTKGSAKKEFFFIRKGLVRSYILNEEGDEITFQLFAEGDIFGNVHAVLFNEKSKFFYQTLEKSKIYAVDYELFMDITSKRPDLLQINRTLLIQKVIQRIFQRTETFVFLSPEKRYLQFVEDHPNLANRVPDMYIANVLGITPVSLSRIRKRITSKKS